MLNFIMKFFKGGSKKYSPVYEYIGQRDSVKRYTPPSRFKGKDNLYKGDFKLVHCFDDSMGMGWTRIVSEDLHPQVSVYVYRDEDARELGKYLFTGDYVGCVFEDED